MSPTLPSLIAVHLDRRAPEFKRAAQLWSRPERYSARVYVSSGYHPNPFGRDGIEIESSSGRIAPSSLPPRIAEPDFILLGGLMAERACLSRAFASLAAMGRYTAGRFTARMPLDAIYALPELDKTAYVKRENTFSRILQAQFGNDCGILLDGRLISGRTNAPATLSWLSRTD